jgi:hypothetical protein
MSVRIGFRDTIKFTSAMEELAGHLPGTVPSLLWRRPFQTGRFNRVYCCRDFHGGTKFGMPWVAGGIPEVQVRSESLV